MFRVVFCVLATFVLSGFVFAQQPATDRKKLEDYIAANKKTP